MFSEDMEMDLTTTEGSTLESVDTDTTEISTEGVKESLEVPESNKKVKRVFYLEPANSKPPVGGVPDKDLVPVTKVDNKVFENGYYLQVGIYINSELVKKDSEKLERLNFPFITVKEDTGERRERVLVGPVSNDELGVIMATLQTRGFKNFFRYKKVDKSK